MSFVISCIEVTLYLFYDASYCILFNLPRCTSAYISSIGHGLRTIMTDV